MNMFRMTGNKVELYRYTTTYTENEVEFQEGLISDEHKIQVEQSLTDRGISFMTTTVDQTANEWIDGLEFDSYDAAMIAFNQGETYKNAKAIETLKAELAETDYQIIKCSEYQLTGQTIPYDMASLHATRQAIREQINSLQVSVTV